MLSFFGRKTRRLEAEIAHLKKRKSILKAKLARLKLEAKYQSDQQAQVSTSGKLGVRSSVGTAINSSAQTQGMVTRSNSFNIKIFTNLIVNLEKQKHIHLGVDNQLRELGRKQVSQLNELLDLIGSCIENSAVVYQKLNATNSESDSQSLVKNQLEAFNALFNSINDIADKTNLLALSGSIEAAKLNGDAVGFKVIIDELKVLSKAVKKISKSSEPLLKDVNEVIEQYETSTKVFNQQLRLLGNDQLYERINQTVVTLLETASYIDNLIGLNRFDKFMTQIKQDHLDYRLKIYKTLLGMAHYNRQELEDMHDSTLGKWYFLGEGKQMLDKHPILGEIEKPHREFRRAGSKSLDYFYDDELDFALSEINLMEKANAQIIQVLGTLYQNLEGQCNTDI